MLEKMTVEELYSKPGFQEMINEYAKLAITKLPAPLYRKEDYMPLEAAGILTVWGYMYEGSVVGFTSCLLSRIPHYGIGIAIAESLFAVESMRGKGIGNQLIAAVEEHARAAGVGAVFMSCPIGSEFEIVLQRRHYSAETITHVKAL